MSETEETCWFCNPAVRTDPPPGGWLVDDGLWRASHVPGGYGPAGSVIVETRRHVLDQSGFADDEAATCATVTGRLIAAVRQVTGSDRVYQWATMDGFPHFHVWLVPWSEDDDLRGPRFLADRLVAADGCDDETAEGTAAALRRALGAGSRVR
jgi:diadenosine tetraphosphate (Ap4A) HIT family hydrolase